MEYYRRNELPETVKRYKAYTDQFQAWLVKTAVQRGVEAANFVEEQAKKVKGNKGKTGHKISIEKQGQLVKAITATNHPLSDTSGLVDLGDAIRSRREVIQFHKFNNTADEGHMFFNENLESILASLKTLLPVMPKERKVKPPTVIYVQFSSNTSTEDNNEALLEEVQKQEDAQTHDDSQTYESPKVKKKPEDDALTDEEVELQRDFLILSFLYDFNRIRDIVREVWLLYHDGSVNAITAATVSDLAQSHMQQAVAALVEELGGSPGQLSQFIERLYDKIKSPLVSSRKRMSPALPSEEALRHLFCLDATALIKAYIAKERPPTQPSDEVSQPEHPLMLFLRYFDVIRDSKFKLPKWDKFTEEILLSRNTSRDCLPFGLQIMMDIQEVVQDDRHRLFKDATEHCLDIARRMRSHVDYEDYMWSIGQKPDYICAEEIKFSTVFLKPLDSLLGWIQELLKAQDNTGPEFGMTTDVFITVHSTLAGMCMWYYNRVYQATAICKIQWFIVGLSHLYNAARKVGGLDLDWPDLEYIIKMHGSQRIFVGTPPTDPYDFVNRYVLACHMSPRFLAPDFRSKSKSAPRTPKETRTKRGLMPDLPLEAKIREFYGPNKDDRWMQRHNIFNYLHKQKESPKKATASDSQEALQELKKLQGTFSAMAAKISPPKSKNRSKRSPVRKPNFSQQDDTYADLFRTMTTELQSHELHSNFDYLSFYRRAFDLILRIRNEVLFNNTQQLARAEKMGKDPDPNNYKLIVELFKAFKLEPGEDPEETTGQEVSTPVLPLDQLKRIAKMMRGFIRKEGNTELVRARLRHGRDWDGLNASYDAEDAEEGASGPEDGEDEEDIEHLVEDILQNDEEDRPQLHIFNQCPKSAGDGVVEDPAVDELSTITEDSPAKTVSQSSALVAHDDEADVGFQSRDQGVSATWKTTPWIPRKRMASDMSNYSDGPHGPTYKPSLLHLEFDAAPAPRERNLQTAALERGLNRRKEDKDVIKAASGGNVGIVTPQKHLSSLIKRLLYQAYVSDENDTPQTKLEQDNRVVQDTSITFVLKAAKPTKQPRKERSIFDGLTVHDIGKPIDYTYEDNLFRALVQPPAPLKNKKKHGSRPAGFYHRFTYSSTTSRKRTITSIHSYSVPITDRLTKYFRLSRPRKRLAAYHHHPTGAASKHSILFPCYAVCSMSRSLCSQETKMQQQMAIAAQIMKTNARRDSLVLEEVWKAAVEQEESEQSWKSEEDGE